MPQSAEAALNALAEHVTELEQLCNEIELGLRAFDYPRLGRAIASSRRKTHEFENAMAEAKAFRTPDFDREIFARLHRIFAVRDGQMKRLEAKRDEIGGRLRTISRWKEYSRSISGPDSRGTKARLFEDRR